ncbi:MAG: potassium channel family protein [Frankia sp.]
MKPQSIGSMTSRQRRTLIVRVLVRSILTIALMVVIYYFLPLHQVVDGETVIVLGGGLIAFAVVSYRQVRSIIHAVNPGIRAVELLSIAVPLFLLVFAVAYFLLERSDHGAFTEPLNRTDALYFAVTVFATVGFGDIAPVSQAARIIAMLQMIGDLVVLGVLVRVVAGAIRMGLKGGPAAPDQGPRPG